MIVWCYHIITFELSTCWSFTSCSALCALLFIHIIYAHHQDVCDMEEWPMILIDCAFAFKQKFYIMHKFRGSSCFSHTSQSVDANHWLYLLSKLWSICCHQLPKRGRLKAQLLPRVVLIIDHNICIIGLICFPNIFQKSSKDAMA